MREKTWTVTSTWTMALKPDFQDAVKFFGKGVRIIDLDITSLEVNGELRWAISLTYPRQYTMEFGERLDEFARLFESETTESVKAANTEEDEDSSYYDLPF